MKRLMLLRHGDAERLRGADDHGRALTATGRAEAEAVAKHLNRPDLRPDLALVSNAKRTHETAELALAHVPELKPWQALRELYGASAPEILAIVQRDAGEAERIIVVGHNPGIGDLGRLLAESGDEDGLATLSQRFPTGAMAVLTVSGSWSDLREGGATLERLILPRQ